MPKGTLASTRRLALAGMFAGLAWGAGYVDSIPNFEFLTVILFAAGWVLGPFGGALAGALGEFLYSAINPYGSGLMHPLVLSSQVAGMALAGVAGGIVGRLRIEQPALRWTAIVLAGVGVTLVFDVLTNLASGAVYGQWKATLLAAIPFALIHVGTNAALFATVGVLLARALERTRRSLLALAAAAALALACAGPARAQVPVPPAAVPLAPPTPADSLARPARAPSAALAAPVDSVEYRDKSRAQVPPAWGEGPAMLLRREDASLSDALTREGGMVERFADDRGSAEPLGRFGLAGANRLLIDWLGMPLTSVGAPGGETLRVPWDAVATLEAPRLPVSATEAYRGELGAVVLAPFRATARHPRVEGWAQAGRPGTPHAGFTAAGAVRRTEGFLAVDAAALAPLVPLGPEGDHAIQARASWSDARWDVSGAYRSARQALEDSTGRFENRKGEGGTARVARVLGGLTARLTLERTAETFADDGELVASTIVRGRGARATLRIERPARPLFAAVTWGRETLESGGDGPFDRRAATLLWADAGGTLALGTWTARAAVGAGRYGKGGKADVAPSLLLESQERGDTRFWAGAARGLTAAPDPRATDERGDSLAGDAPVQRSSTWLAGIGVTRRSRFWADGGSWRGPAPGGALSARAALYAGRSTPGTDPARFLFAGQAIENAPFEPSGDATRFVALTLTGNWAPRTGLAIDAGGHVLGRVLDGALFPSDPEARAYLALEGRHRFGQDGPDARVGATGTWIGARVGTPAGDLPAATRLGIFAGLVVDEFELRASWGNLAGANRLLPLLDPITAAPLPADGRRLRVEARWTFWD